MPNGTVRCFPTNRRQQHLSAGPRGSFKRRVGREGGDGAPAIIIPQAFHVTTQHVALGGESPGGLLRCSCVFMARGRLRVRLQERRSRGPIKDGLRTRDDINSLYIIPEGGKKNKKNPLCVFALDCTARPFLVFFFLLLFSSSSFTSCHLECFVTGRQGKSMGVIHHADVPVCFSGRRFSLWSS